MQVRKMSLSSKALRKKVRHSHSPIYDVRVYVERGEREVNNKLGTAKIFLKANEQNIRKIM